MIICVFGDSVAFGKYDRERGGWVERLRLYCMQKEMPPAYLNVYNLAIPGATSRVLVSQISTERKVRQADIVVVAIGINDSVLDGDNPVVPLQKFQANIADIHKNVDCTVVFVGLTPVNDAVLDPVPWRTTSQMKQTQAEKYNSALQKYCLDQDIPFVSIIDELDHEDLHDGVHPNAQGHEKIFFRVKIFLEKKGLLTSQ